MKHRSQIIHASIQNWTPLCILDIFDHIFRTSAGKRERKVLSQEKLRTIFSSQVDTFSAQKKRSV